MEDPNQYNQITVKNIDDEDFVFSVNRESYLIKAGEIRIFPKFMVRPMLKHLIDKILIKEDGGEGKLLRVQAKRDALAAQIVLKEEAFERPHVPSDREIVETMNRQPELDRILAKNKQTLRTAEPAVIPAPVVDTAKMEVNGTSTPLIPTFTVPTVVQPVSIDQPVSTEPEKFDQIEEEKNRPMPNRDAMLNYAKSVLKLDISDPKTKKVWDKMTDTELFKELGLDKEEDLKALGL